MRSVLLAWALTLAGPAWGVTVSLTPEVGDTELTASIFIDPGFPCCRFSQSPKALPVVDRVSIPAGFQPPFEATLDYDLSDDGFFFGYVTSRSDTEDDRAAAEGSVYFTVDEDVDYVLSGEYAMDDPSGHIATFDVALLDLDDAVTLYRTAHHNNGAPNAAFDLGIDGFETILEGSTSGTLRAGRSYRLTFAAQTLVFMGPPADDIVGTGTGGLRLVFAPEPGAAALALGALAALGFLARHGG